jgi:hypothetical protein
VVHSPQDEIIPYRYGKALFQSAKDPKAFFELKGDHNGGFILTGEDYRHGLEAFLRSIAEKEGAE